MGVSTSPAHISRYKATGRGWYRKGLSLFALLRLALTARVRRLPFGLSFREALRVWRKLADGDTTKDISLPSTDPVAVRVHGGFKTFDPAHARVTKVFSEEVPVAAQEAEVTHARRAGKLPCAPSWQGELAVNYGYVEELISGPTLVSLASGDTNLYRYALPQVVELLEQSWQLYPTHPTDVRTLVEAPIAHISTNREHINAVLPGCGDATVAFAEELDVTLRPHSGTTLFRGFSHGDFSLLNIIQGANGLRVIDWESADERSLLNDLFNYLAVELYYGRAGSELEAVVHEALDLVQQRVSLFDDQWADSVARHNELYRRVFYLERLAVLCERGVTHHGATVIHNSVDVFRQFEERLAKPGV